jgi:3-methyl-2-oxobutanoate hydroxymethyltransferase
MPSPPITLQTLARMAREGQRFACLTAYDATTARWLERAGVHVLLVGDTAAEVILGLPRTLHMPLEILLALTAGVKRGAPRTVVMGDMPFLSYHGGEDEAVMNAGKFFTQGLADIVKLEVDASFANVIQRISRAGMPVCAHVGSRPQRAAMTGSYGSAGRTHAEAKAVVDDAKAAEDAGAVMLLVEAVPPQVTDLIRAATTLPLIGIGAGPACHGQVLVFQDLMGMTDDPPRFAERSANLGTAIQAAAENWVLRVAAGSVGGQLYTMKEE